MRDGEIDRERKRERERGVLSLHEWGKVERCERPSEFSHTLVTPPLWLSKRVEWFK